MGAETYVFKSLFGISNQKMILVSPLGVVLLICHSFGFSSHLDYAPDPETNSSNSDNRPQNIQKRDTDGSQFGSNLKICQPADGGHLHRPAQPKYYNIEDIVNSDMDTVVDVTDKERGYAFFPESSAATSSKIGRKIAVIRHAETMNEAFPEWYSHCIVRDHYTTKDLNHPTKLPARSKGLIAYNVDPPITRLAKHASRILGKALAQDTSIKWDNVISAPELASAQTAAAIAFSTTGDKAFINIDETLYDFSHGKIDFMTPMELMKYDITVKLSDLAKSRDESENSISRVLGEFEKVQHQYKGNLIIVVGATAFDAVVQRLIGNTERGRAKKRPRSIPQLACVILEKGRDSWKLYNKQVLPFRSNSTTSVLFDPISYYSSK